MIWVKDQRCRLTYICEDWYRITGQELDESLGFGWLAAIHPDDRPLIEHSVKEACRHRVEFMMRFRIRRQNGSYVWIIDAATPSFAPLTHDFIGYLGLISQYQDDTQDLTAKAEVGAFKPGRAAAEFGPVSKLDIIADHLIMAKAASVGCAPEVMTAIDGALHAAGRALVVEMQRNTQPESLH